MKLDIKQLQIKSYKVKWVWNEAHHTSINQGGDTNRVPQYGKYHYDGRSPE